jgi:hypothetical protein
MFSELRVSGLALKAPPISQQLQLGWAVATGPREAAGVLKGQGFPAVPKVHLEVMRRAWKAAPLQILNAGIRLRIAACFSQPAQI